MAQIELHLGTNSRPRLCINMATPTVSRQIRIVSLKVRRQDAFLSGLGHQVGNHVTVFGGNGLVCVIVTRNLEKLLLIIIIIIISSQLDVLLVLLR